MQHGVAALPGGGFDWAPMRARLPFKHGREVEKVGRQGGEQPPWERMRGLEAEGPARLACPRLAWAALGGGGGGGGAANPFHNVALCACCRWSLLCGLPVLPAFPDRPACLPACLPLPAPLQYGKLLMELVAAAAVPREDGGAQPTGEAARCRCCWQIRLAAAWPPPRQALRGGRGGCGPQRLENQPRHMVWRDGSASRQGSRCAPPPAAPPGRRLTSLFWLCCVPCCLRCRVGAARRGAG